MFTILTQETNRPNVYIDNAAFKKLFNFCFKLLKNLNISILDSIFFFMFKICWIKFAASTGFSLANHHEGGVSH